VNNFFAGSSQLDYFCPDFGFAASGDELKGKSGENPALSP